MHKLNAYASIDVTEGGIVTCVNDLHSEKAYSSINFTE